MSGREDANEARRRYQKPYGPKHSIPTIQKYREEKADRRDAAGLTDGEDDDDESRMQRAKDYWNSRKEEGDAETGADGGSHGHAEEDGKKDDVEEYPDQDPSVTEDTSQTMGGGPKDKRKGMKKRKDERAEREVTDPVTHLPVT